jgi:hypothetical protein
MEACQSGQHGDATAARRNNTVCPVTAGFVARGLRMAAEHYGG